MTTLRTTFQSLPFIHRVALVGLILRVALALVAANIHHADELIQYLEQGHRLAFGFGNVTWEFRFGFRSYLIPFLISGLLRALDLAQLGSPDIYVPSIKIFFSILSVSLIYSVYSLGQSLFSEAAGRAAAIFSAGWYELVYIASKPNPEVLGMYLLLFGLACLMSPRPVPRAIGFGVACSIAVALRIQYAPVAALLGIVALLRWGFQDTLRALGASVLVVGVVGLVDYAIWGTFLGSYRNSIAFEQAHRISSYWGIRPLYYYPAVLTLASGGLILVALAVAVRHARKAWVPVACVVAVIGFHTLFPHKEYRYVFATIPIMCLFLGQAATWFSSRLGRVVLGVPLAVSLMGFFYVLPFESKAYREPVYKRSDMILAYTAARRDPDLAGLWLTSIAGTDSPGYYHLHRDVPVYFFDQLSIRNITIDPKQSVSHILCPAGHPEVPGFRTIERFGELELRKQVKLPARYEQLYPTRDLLQPGVDGVLEGPVPVDRYL